MAQVDGSQRNSMVSESGSALYDMRTTGLGFASGRSSVASFAPSEGLYALANSQDDEPPRRKQGKRVSQWNGRKCSGIDEEGLYALANEYDDECEEQIRKELGDEGTYALGCAEGAMGDTEGTYALGCEDLAAVVTKGRGIGAGKGAVRTARKSEATYALGSEDLGAESTYAMATEDDFGEVLRVADGVDVDDDTQGKPSRMTTMESSCSIELVSPDELYPMAEGDNLYPLAEDDGDGKGGVDVGVSKSSGEATYSQVKKKKKKVAPRLSWDPQADLGNA
jgi:hypothetical protein